MCNASRAVVRVQHVLWGGCQVRTQLYRRVIHLDTGRLHRHLARFLWGQKLQLLYSFLAFQRRAKK
jgi:hypothetical protein